MEDRIFNEINVSGIKLKNRLIRSATHEGMADNEGFPSDKLKKLYIKLSKGNVGGIITGYIGIQKEGKTASYGMCMLDTDEHIKKMKEITNAVHEYNTPIIAQLVHCGRQTRSAVTGYNTYGPSAVKHSYFNEEVPKELCNSEIETIIENFLQGIYRAKKAGFDGVQLHAAHGFLLSDFLSSHSNLREDKWGGSIENKCRIITTIISKAKKEFPDFPIWIKMNGHDNRKNGIRKKEAGKIAKLLENAGCNLIEVSCGTAEDGLYNVRTNKVPIEPFLQYNFKAENLPPFVKTILKPFLRVIFKSPKPLSKYNVEAAMEIKKALDIPVCVVGGIHNYKDVDEVIVKKRIDLVSLSRPLIIEPDFVKKLENKISTESKCLKCNYCIVLAESKSLKCYYGRLLKK